MTGPVTDGTSVTLTAGGTLSLAAAVQTGALSLTATGAITQPGGGITASSLTGSGAGVALTAAGNSVGTLGAFASTGDFALTDGVGFDHRRRRFGRRHGENPGASRMTCPASVPGWIAERPRAVRLRFVGEYTTVIGA